MAIQRDVQLLINRASTNRMYTMSFDQEISQYSHDFSTSVVNGFTWFIADQSQDCAYLFAGEFLQDSLAINLKETRFTRENIYTILQLTRGKPCESSLFKNFERYGNNRGKISEDARYCF